MRHIITIFAVSVAVVLSAVESVARESETYAPFPHFNEISCKLKEKFRLSPWCHDCICDVTGKSGTYLQIYHIYSVNSHTRHN